MQIILKLSKLTALLSAFENVVYLLLFLNDFSRTHCASFLKARMRSLKEFRSMAPYL
jgi:hypothetical protein